MPCVDFPANHPAQQTRKSFRQRIAEPCGSVRSAGRIVELIKSVAELEEHLAELASQVLLGEGLLFAACRRFEQGKPFEHGRYVKWIAQAPLPLYAVILFGCGWPNVLVPMALERAFLVDHLVTV